ncbi:hypothetical protein OS493_031273 [Desmophyllum pertusum]|uniref:FZ domain-containing protein n=1 Tax=Desmophyllum pertusum TaxID=174260 RepID=A0A9W9Z8V4_9CNID|nr:hypothetical protein OS493_031273 [Desmophyllum pertusum]
MFFVLNSNDMLGPSSECTATTSMLPCKEVCKRFVADCQHISGANEGLLALFRGVCEVLTGPSGKCLPKSGNFSGVHDSEEVKCRRLVIRQCQNAGYNFTSVSDEYQQMVNSSAIFQDSDVNSKLRKIICMEIAPPCDEKHNKTLLVPCRAMCNDAFNESSAQFLKVFNNTEYCSAFPENTTVNGSEYCSLQAWPSNGYWPSSLWTSLDTAEPTLAPTAIVTMPASDSYCNQACTDS